MKNSTKGEELITSEASTIVTQFYLFSFIFCLLLFPSRTALPPLVLLPPPPTRGPLPVFFRRWAAGVLLCLVALKSVISALD